MSIALLFARDPLKHSRDDIRTIVEHFRAQRKDFKIGGRTAAKQTPKQAEAAKVVGEIDIGDL